MGVRDVPEVLGTERLRGRHFLKLRNESEVGGKLLGVWCAVGNMQRMQKQAKRGLQASVVQQYLAAGATPSISQNGASALLLTLVASPL